jgi:hypothetical protein
LEGADKCVLSHLAGIGFGVAGVSQESVKPALITPDQFLKGVKRAGLR